VQLRIDEDQSSITARGSLAKTVGPAAADPRVAVRIADPDAGHPEALGWFALLPADYSVDNHSRLLMESAP
jgi:hypothetical protein